MCVLCVVCVYCVSCLCSAVMLSSCCLVTEEDVKRLIEFRASNESLFTGKRNSAKIAWK